MSVDKNTLGSMIEKQVIVIKNSGEIVSGEMIGIIRGSVLIDVNGQGVSLPLDDILTMTESRANLNDKETEVQVKQTILESEGNVLEKALIADDVQKIQALLEDKEPLLELGYTEDQIIKMQKCFTYGMCRGTDYFSIATRLDGFQGNRDRVAEKYFEKATNGDLGKSKESRAYKRLYSYYMLEGRYEEFLRVGQEQNLFDPKKVQEIIFWAKALVATGKDGMEFLREQPLKFSNQGDYVYVMKYLEENPDSITAAHVSERILTEEVFYVAAEYVLKYYLKNGTVEEFQQAKKKFIANYKEKIPEEKFVEVLKIGSEIESEHCTISKEEFVQCLEKYDEKKVRALLNDMDKMQVLGYTEIEVAKFHKMLDNHSFPTGNSDFEVGSRLMTWGFGSESVKYHEKVASNPKAEKRKSSVNQMLSYAYTVKDHSLFMKYWEEKEKKDEGSGNFYCECLYLEGKYDKLYDMYQNREFPNAIYLWKGVLYAILQEDEKQLQKEMTEKVLQMDTFDFVFWNGYLKELFKANRASYQEIIIRLLQEHLQDLSGHEIEMAKLLELDENFAWKDSEEGIFRFLSKEYPLGLVLLLYQAEPKQHSEENKDQILCYALKEMQNMIDEMKYAQVVEVSAYLLDKFPRNERVEELSRMAGKGLDVFNMLPAGQDNYSIGKRILLLDENPKKAYVYFKNEIRESEDLERVALCGSELLKALYEEGKYEEVIKYGKIILTERKAVHYSSVALDMLNSFEALADEVGRVQFVEVLATLAKEAITQKEYQSAFGLMKQIQVFDKNHAFVLAFREVLEKIETEGISLDSRTFLGKGNTIKYLEKDEEKYFAFLKQSFEDGQVEEKYRTESAIQILEIGRLPAYHTQVFEFIDRIGTYGIIINEHMADLLYEIIVSSKNIDSAICYFTKFRETTEKENKKNILAKLEKLYEQALFVGAEFDIEKALEHVWEYFQMTPSLKARFCYIWILLVANRTREAEDLLALTPEDVPISAKQKEISDKIIEQYFGGIRPTIESTFENKVKNDTFLQILEHCKKYKDFVMYSKQEEKIHTELLKNNQYRVDAANPVAKRAVIKTIYETTLQYKSWYRYLLCVKEKNDVVLDYCIHVNLTLINQDLTNDKADKHLSYLLRKEEEARNRNSQYKLYNELYKLYLRNEYQKTPSIISKLTNLGKDKKFFSQAKENKTKLAKDYIQLLKLLDDRDDYIYVKTAMFIATNNKCEDYFYSLFKHDLLSREQEICIKMCLEMLWDKRAKDRETILRIVEDFDGISTEHRRILQVLRKIANTQITTSKDERRINELCSILKDYPKAPAEENIVSLIEKYKNDSQFAISVLELVDECYQENTFLRKQLFQLYRKSNSKEYYEKMYQNCIGFMQGLLAEESLYEMARMAILIATIMEKKGRYSDITALYREKSIEGLHEKKLEEFALACGQLIVTEEGKEYCFLKAMISEEWMDILSEYGMTFVKELKGCSEVMDFAKVSFARDAFSYITNMLDTQENDIVEVISRARVEFLEAAQLIFNNSLEGILKKFCDMDTETRKYFVDMISLGQKKINFLECPRDDEFVENVMELWSILYGREYVIRQMMKWKMLSLNSHTFYLAAISKYQDIELLNAYVKLLYENKCYEEVCTLRDKYLWANDSLIYITYFAVALLHSNPTLGLNYISRTSGEKLVNIVLLLKKQMLHEEIQNICNYNRAKKPMIEMVLQILERAELEVMVTIEEKFNTEDRIALLKLLYCCLGNMESESKMIEKHGDVVLSNDYISIGRNMIGAQKNYIIETKEKAVEKKADKKILKHFEFVELVQAEISVQKYENGIPEFELKRLLDLYESLGSIKENTEYRKELLTKMLYITKEQGMEKMYYDFVTKLGVVLFYSYVQNDMQQARNVLCETILILGEDSKRKTVSQIRECVCEMLAKFESVEEIAMNKDKIVMALEHLLDYSNTKAYSAFLKYMLELTTKVSAIASAKDISQRTHNYSHISSTLQTNIAKNQDNQLWGQVYTQWYRIVQSEITRLSKGAVLELEVETKQCGLRGKICCVIRNNGKKKAEKINVKAIFEGGIRCRDTEKAFPVIYGGDMITFAFQIRCKEERVHKYKIELTYESNQNAECISYNEEIRIGMENEYEYINNLYSTAPVMINSEFYGREREKQEIMNFLNDVTYNTSIVMHGLKRVGKTSMLRYIERSMLDSQIYIPIYKSAQSIGDQNAIGNMFVKSVIEELETRGIIDEEFRRYQEFNCDQSPEQLYEFYQYLQNSNVLEGKRILFMADEIEEIFDNVDQGLINRRFYKVLRVILQELTSVRFIFCGADHLTDILYNHALADVFEITKRVIISRIEEDAMKQMIYEPAKNKIWYTTNAIDRIWYYTKGHTFYSKHICSKIIDILNEESRTTAYAYDVDIALKEIMRITEYFIYLSRFFSESDSKVVKLLCDNLRCAGDKISVDTLEMSYVGQGLTDSLMGLEFKDIIEKTERYDGDYYQFSIEMFRLWYSKAEYVTLEKEEE